jgi:hypothetical protein
MAEAQFVVAHRHQRAARVGMADTGGQQREQGQDRQREQVEAGFAVERDRSERKRRNAGYAIGSSRDVDPVGYDDGEAHVQSQGRQRQVMSLQAQQDAAGDIGDQAGGRDGEQRRSQGFQPWDVVSTATR